MIQQLIGISLAIGTAGFTSSEDAKKKGYDPVIWFFAGLNILGVFILLFLPNLEKIKELSDEERKSKQKRGDKIGNVLALFSVIAIVVMIILSVININ